MLRTSESFCVLYEALAYLLDVGQCESTSEALNWEDRGSEWRQR